MSNSKKRTSLLILSVLVAFICCAAVFAAPMQKAKAEEVFDPASIESKCAELSDTDILEGADLTGNDAEPTVIDYIERMPTDDFVFNSDWLYRIIPIELFINECEYYHSGKAYSYYIRTYGTEQFSSDVFLISHNPVPKRHCNR